MLWHPPDPVHTAVALGRTHGPLPARPSTVNRVARRDEQGRAHGGERRPQGTPFADCSHLGHSGASAGDPRSLSAHERRDAEQLRFVLFHERARNPLPLDPEGPHCGPQNDALSCLSRILRC